MDKKVTLAQLKEVVQEAYDQVKTNTGKHFLPFPNITRRAFAR